MKSKFFKYIPAAISVAVIGLALSACQKKFDPSSYAPAQTFNGYTASSQVAKSNLVAYFGFENNLTDSISGTSATNYGTSFTTGIKGQALQVGLNNYTLFPATPAIKALTSFTVAYWFNTTQNSAGIQEMICFVHPSQFWSNLDMFLDGQTASSAVLKSHVYGNAGTLDAWMTNWTLSNLWGNWVHVALSYDQTANIFVLYVNGVQFGTNTQAGFGNINFSNVPTVIFGTVQFMTTPSLTTGATAQPWASFLLGSMDQVRIYNAALAAADVKALYQLENLGK